MDNTDGTERALLLDLAHDAILVRDCGSGLIRYWNRGAEALYGWSRGEALGQNSHQLLRAEYPRPLATIEEELEERGSWEGELVHTARDGGRLVVQSRWALQRDPSGAVTACMEINRDISRRKRIEERQRFLVEASQALAESLDFQTTLQTVARLAIPVLADWCGVSVWGEGGMRTLTWPDDGSTKVAAAAALQQRYPLDQRHYSSIARVIQTGEALLIETVTDDQLNASAQDPEHLALLRALGLTSVLVVPLRVHERTLGFVAFLMGESGRHFQRDDLVVAQDLAARCALAVENARLYREAQEAVRVRDEFLSSAAHDLRGPLGTIRGFSQLLRQQATASPALRRAQLDQFITPIERAASQMDEQIQELTDLAQLQMGRALELRRWPTDLVTLAQHVTEECQRATAAHQLHVRSSQARLVGHWDERRLHRVLTNLLVNAIAYSPGGGAIHVEIEEEERPDGPWALLRVRDSGLGIPAEDLPRLFSRFHRGRNVPSIVRGTGIGLASVRQIVEQHDGTVHAESSEGQGSTFTVRLPLRMPPASS